MNVSLLVVIDCIIMEKFHSIFGYYVTNKNAICLGILEQENVPKHNTQFRKHIGIAMHVHVALLLV